LRKSKIFLILEVVWVSCRIVVILRMWLV